MRRFQTGFVRSCRPAVWWPGGWAGKGRDFSVRRRSAARSLRRRPISMSARTAGRGGRVHPVRSPGVHVRRFIRKMGRPNRLLRPALGEGGGSVGADAVEIGEGPDSVIGDIGTNACFCRRPWARRRMFVLEEPTAGPRHSSGGSGEVFKTLASGGFRAAPPHRAW